VAFGATVAGRPADLPGIEQQVGLFINTLPVIGAPRPEQRGPMAASGAGAEPRLRDFEHTPLADIQRWAGQGGEALFDNILVFENYPIAEALSQAAGLRSVRSATWSRPTTLTLAVTSASNWRCTTASTAPVCRAAIEGISAHLQQLLSSLRCRPSATSAKSLCQR
jgi:non-ribosomal peptide synthetase component F